MTKFALALAVLAALAPAAAFAVQADSVLPAPPAPPAQTAAPTRPVDMANDPRMLAAIRHANARADEKCGGIGVSDLQTKMAARNCRRHMVDAAKLDAEFEINPH
ncbi:hypothetical protein KZX46_20080 [Polymorphobacter sp. PAMC 29334]|uniref:hypothetical protein n=1 Tax=Polymorphobacter sp. PAMC 29334 TaxID=2862331 RepID=UPI001C798CDD|nr:hypothetical protein [Polymorphobacter sp. PAMC 29334]QYE34991.1 hypothetical protein KZX46_20080 [Polymorphobacter sp. PAMC 29334]